MLGLRLQPPRRRAGVHQCGAGLPVWLGVVPVHDHAAGSVTRGLTSDRHDVCVLSARFFSGLNYYRSNDHMCQMFMSVRYGRASKITEVDKGTMRPISSRFISEPSGF